jgi:hypothetical protein
MSAKKFWPMAVAAGVAITMFAAPAQSRYIFL